MAPTLNFYACARAVVALRSYANEAKDLPASDRRAANRAASAIRSIQASMPDLWAGRHDHKWSRGRCRLALRTLRQHLADAADRLEASIQ
jgi:hypothetical protein